MSWHYRYNSLWKVLVPDELRAAEWEENTETEVTLPALLRLWHRTEP